VKTTIYLLVEFRGAGEKIDQAGQQVALW